MVLMGEKALEITAGPKELFNGKALHAVSARTVSNAVLGLGSDRRMLWKALSFQSSRYRLGHRGVGLVVPAECTVGLQ